MNDSYLAISGSKVVDGAGRPIVLRGINLGSWMNWEGFILGLPATETPTRLALRRTLGSERYERFSERLLDSFYGDADAAYLAALGFNTVRIPINYRHFEDDQQPFGVKPDGFRHLDRVIATNARHGIYSIIDLHAAQGWQNRGWHSDNMLGEPLTWAHPNFQDRIAWLWAELASHYHDERWVAGYNLLNEPEDGSRTLVGPFYQRLMRAIREIDGDHLFFLDGNDWGRDFDEFEAIDTDAVFCAHQYPPVGEAGPQRYPGWRAGAYWDRDDLERQFLELTSWVRARGAPLFMGEFGTVDEGNPDVFRTRLQLVRDLLDIYHEHGAGWTYWTYKDIGIAGVVRVAPSSPWVTRLAEPIAKKRRLAADYWGTPAELAREVQGTLADLLEREFPEDRWQPWGTHVEPGRSSARSSSASSSSRTS